MQNHLFEAGVFNFSVPIFFINKSKLWNSSTTDKKLNSLHKLSRTFLILTSQPCPKNGINW